jgi:hypothetical protein
MKEYWCVICEHCHPLIAIPVLECDRTKQRQNPRDFQATCHRCGATSAFDETELEVRKIERVPAFQPADGFRNVSQLMGSLSQVIRRRSQSQSEDGA